MPSAFEHLKNLKWGLGYLLSGIAWAVVLVTTIQAYLGGTQYESPLLYTLLAVTLSTMAVGVITAGVSVTLGTPDREQISETATASYVFANAAGTLATLIGHLAETWETGWKTHEVESRDALSLILGLLDLPPETFFITYVATTACFALLSFPLVLWGAHLIVGKHIASSGELAAVGGISLLLLIVGLMIGSPWAPVDADTRAAMSMYGAGLHIATLVLIALGFFVVAVLFVLSLGRFAAVFSLSSLRFGAKISVQEMLAIAGRVALQFWYGLLGGVAGVAIIGLIWLFGTPLVLSLPFLSEASRFRFADAFTHGLVEATVFVLWTFLGAVAVLLLRVFGKATAKGLFQLIAWLFIGAFNLLKFVIAFLLFIFGVLVEALKATVRLFRWLFDPKGEPPVSTAPRPKRSAWLSGLWSRVAPKFARPRIDWGGIAKLAAGLFLSVALVGVCVFTFNVISSLFNGTRGAPQAEEVADNRPPPPPGFESSTPHEISICEAPPGGFDWANAREDRLEIALNDCALPARIQNQKNGVLVVVSVASFSNNEAEEVQRALRRARALAQWASLRTPVGMPVYVLNLGMARSERAFGVGWSAFGQVRGVRPALGLMLSPNPEGSTVPLSNVLEELANGLRFARVSSSFTNCELYEFDLAVTNGDQLQPVSGFNCQAL